MKKGPIRWKGFIPFIIIAVLVYVFATYFIDGVLKNLISKNATQLNGALVEMKSLRLSFIQSSLTIKGLEITNPKNLMQNRFEIKDLIFDFEFLPLLKKKFVTDEIKVDGVRWLTKRTKEGKIPSKWQKEWETDKGVINPFISQAVANLTDKVKAELPDISVDSLKEKFDPRKAIKIKEMSSYKRAFEVRDEAKKTYSSWQGNIKNVISDQKKFIEDTKRKITSLNPKAMNNPQSILSAISTVQSFDKDFKDQKNLVSSNLSKAKSDIDKYSSEIKNIPALIKSDVKSITDKYSFGSFDMSNFSKQIFGMRWVPYFQKYVESKNRLLAYKDRWVKSKPDETPKKARMAGINIPFPITDGIPKFLIKMVNLSARTGKKLEDNELYRGSYELKALDISSDQKIYGKPSTVNLKLESFSEIFEKANADLVLDYRKSPEKDEMKIKIENFKLAGYTLGKKSSFPIPLKAGFANAQISGGSIGDKVRINIGLDIFKAVYAFEKSKNYVVGLIQEIMNTINKFRVEIEFFGTLKDPSLKIRSTLDNAIGSGIKKVFLEKLNEVKTKAENYIRVEVDKLISGATEELNNLKSKIQTPLDEQKNRLDSLSNEAKKKIDDLKKRQSELLKSKLGGQTKGVEDKIKKIF